MGCPGGQGARRDGVPRDGVSGGMGCPAMGCPGRQARRALRCSTVTLGGRWGRSRAGTGEPGTGAGAGGSRTSRPRGAGADPAPAPPERLMRLQTGKGVCVKSGGREQSVLLFSIKPLGFVTALCHCPEASKVPLQKPKVSFSRTIWLNWVYLRRRL